MFRGVLTRMAGSLNTMPYHSRLRIIGLPTLEYRRVRADMVHMYKIIHDIDKIGKDKQFTMSAYTATRGNSFMFFKKRARPGVRKNTFSHRVVDTWNSLPDSVILAPSVNSFKGKLNKFWEGHPLKCNAVCYE